jgi:PBSX family phage terminase large subunit
MTTDLPMSPKQAQSIRESGGGRVNIWEGSVRSGKTIASLWAWVHYIATTAHYQGDLLVIGRTRGSIARNVFGRLQDESLFGEVSKHVHYTNGADKGTILGRTVWVMGASDAKAHAVIKGATSSGEYVDEVTVIPEEFFTQALNRLWGPAQLFGTTNPDNPAHWFKRKFLDRVGMPGPQGLRNWRTWHFLLDDNPALPEHQKASIRRENVGLWYRRFVLGEWVAAEGAIYHMWDPTEHVVAWDALPHIDRLLAVGIDYGTTNATSAVLLGMTGSGQLVLVDEWRHDSRVPGNTPWTDAEQSASLQAWLKVKHTPQVGDPPLEQIYLDPSAKSLSTQMWQDGIGNVHAVNDVVYGIRTMATLLGQRRLVVSDRCGGFISEAPGYTWDQGATERGIDQPNKGADHSLDAARYAVVSTEPIWREALVDRVGIAVLRHQIEDEQHSEVNFMTVPM